MGRKSRSGSRAGRKSRSRSRRKEKSPRKEKDRSPSWRPTKRSSSAASRKARSPSKKRGEGARDRDRREDRGKSRDDKDRREDRDRRDDRAEEKRSRDRRDDKDRDRDRRSAERERRDDRDRRDDKEKDRGDKDREKDRRDDRDKDREKDRDRRGDKDRDRDRDRRDGTAAPWPKAGASALVLYERDRDDRRGSTRASSREVVVYDGKRKEREARKNEEEALKKRIKDEVEAKEAAQKARAKEIADRQQEEINKRQEHVAALKARKMLQRLHRPALPDNISKAEFEKLVDEVRNAIEDSSEEMGSLAENMREQCEKAVAEAETRVFRCDALAKERAKLADDADCKVSEAQRALQALSQQTTVEDPAEMLERVMHAEGAVEACSEALEAALKDLPSAMAELGPSERTILWEETGQEEKVNFRELNSRMTTHKLTLTKLRMSFKTEKERVTRRAQALANERKLKDKFKLYDRGGKGHMDKADVAIMAGAEFQCELSGEQLDNLFRRAAGSGPGVPFERFQGLRSMCTIEAGAVKKRQEAEAEAARKALLDIERNQLSSKFNDIEALQKEAQEAANQAGVLARNLQGNPLVSRQSSEDVKKAVDDVKAQLSVGRGLLERARASAEAAQVTQDGEGASDTPQRAELILFYSQSLTKVKQRHAMVEANLEQSAQRIAFSERLIRRAECREMDQARIKAAQLLSSEDNIKELKARGFFGGGSGGLVPESFVDFLKDLHERHKDPFPEGQEAAYRRLHEEASGENGLLSMDGLEEVSTLHFEAIKPSVLCEAASVSSGVLRRLEIGEVVRQLSKPEKVDGGPLGSGILRIRCRAVKDKAEGWVSIESDKGTVFLKPCSKYYVCSKPLLMKSGEEASCPIVRSLVVGDVIEIMEYPANTVKVEQVRARFVGSDDTGWVNRTSSGGPRFLEPC